MPIKTVLLVHHTHVDLGYTDPPRTALRLNCAYIDAALEAIERSAGAAPEARFCWTQEVFLPLKLWWERAGAKKRARLLRAVAAGTFDVGALPAGMTDLPGEAEWAYMLDLLPAAIREARLPQLLMQNDVNGISRRGVEMAWDRGVRLLWMGPNSYYGIPPEPAPFAFYWQLSPGKRVLAWCNPSYNDGTFLFNENWRQGPVPAAHDLCYRPPEPGDIFACNQEALEAAHARLQARLDALTGGVHASVQTDGFTKAHGRTDYPYDTLITSIAGQWRCDNDPPFAALSDFVEAWNAAGYTPRLKLATASAAMREFERCAGEFPVREGVWTDHWSNGLAASPAQTGAVREARRVLAAASAPALGRLTRAQRSARDEALHDMMLYEEHTFAAWESAADPCCANSRAQLAEKEAIAYRALEGARMFRALRARAALRPAMDTVTVLNSAPFARVVRLDLPRNALRGDYRSLLAADGRKVALEPRPGRGNFLRPSAETEFREDDVTRAFADALPGARVVSQPFFVAPGACVELRLCREAAEEPPAPALPEVRVDALGWPVHVRFADAPVALLDGQFGCFRSVRAKGISPRWTFKDVFDADTQAERDHLRANRFFWTDARYEPAARWQERSLLIFTQRFSHPSLRLGRRTLEIDLCTRRATLTVKIDRPEDFAPEIFYIGFRAPCGEGVPEASLTGQSFRPFADALPGTCRDFFAIDGYLRYGEGAHWSWFARDSALVCVGPPRPCARSEAPPDDPREFWAQVLDNTWDTNFDPAPHGRMLFRFDVATDAPAAPLAFFEHLAAEPVVLVRAREQR